MPEVTVRINGQRITVPAGTLVAAAIAQAGVMQCRTSVRGEPRGPLCGMGICFECRATLNGVPHVRTCQRVCEPEMEIVTSASERDFALHLPEGDSESASYDVAVVGAGPAGLAAAACAAEAGASVLLLDDNPNVGGQIWRGEDKNPATAEAAKWRARVRSAEVTVLCGARVFDATPGVLLAETAAGIRVIRASRLILCTGARERFLPFPGWTLPNVMGAGGLQAMAKSGMPIEGKRVLVAGTGPLLLAVAAYLVAHGAEVCAIAEQTSLARLAGFAARLLTKPGKLAQAIALRRKLSRVPYLTNCWPAAAQGGDRLQSVKLSRRGRIWDVACDYLACGFHLVPNVEVAALLGCRIERGFVAIDEWQRTSVAGTYCAGEPTGIGGVELSTIEGQIAGLAAAGRNYDAQRLFGERRKFTRFAAAMERAFELRPELRNLCDGADDVLLCRCEDVSIARARRHRSWREAKLHTRCGMGPCQGRVCGSATAFLFGWQTESVRPPVFPAQVTHLAAAPSFSESLIEEHV